MNTGLLNISAADYHADQLGDNGTPSLSAGICGILVNSSPAHAWAAHPRLNPNFKPREEAKFDLGRVAHQVMLEGKATVCVVDHDSWRTNDAKEARDRAREAGLTPLLAADWENVKAVVVAAYSQLGTFDVDPKPFTQGKPEQTIVWHEPNGVCCKARVDWLHDGFLAVDDYKTTSRSANPESWARSTLYSIGADIQVAFYLRGLEAVTGKRPEWRYVVQETFPPYALSVISLSPDVLELGNAKVEHAIDVWARCLKTNEWDGYPRKLCWAEAPAWELSRWLEREAREELVA